MVEKVDGLNSTRTLRRWTELAITSCDAKFHYDYMNVGYKNTHIKYLAYTDEDIKKFQFVASNKLKLGLNSAIQQAFNNEAQITLSGLDNRINNLIEQVNIILASKSEQIGKLEKQKIFLSQENYRLTRRIEKLEQALENKNSLKHYWRERASPR
jgi:hypothetical protein